MDDEIEQSNFWHPSVADFKTTDSYDWWHDWFCLLSGGSITASQQVGNRSTRVSFFISSRSTAEVCTLHASGQYTVVTQPRRRACLGSSPENCSRWGCTVQGQAAAVSRQHCQPALRPLLSLRDLTNPRYREISKIYRIDWKGMMFVEKNKIKIE